MTPPSEVRPVGAFGGHPLTVGAHYRVTFEDCCAEGWFTGGFVGVRFTEDVAGSGVLDFPAAAVFTTGEVGPDWGAISFEAVPDVAAG